MERDREYRSDRDRYKKDRRSDRDSERDRSRRRSRDRDKDYKRNKPTENDRNDRHARDSRRKDKQLSSRRHSSKQDIIQVCHFSLTCTFYQGFYITITFGHEKINCFFSIGFYSYQTVLLRMAE